MSLEETASSIERRMYALRDGMLNYFNDPHTRFNPEGRLYSARGATTYSRSLRLVAEITRHYQQPQEQVPIAGNEYGMPLRGRGQLTKKVIFEPSNKHPGKIRIIMNDGLQERPSGSRDEALRILELDDNMIAYLQTIATFDEQHYAKDGTPQLRFLEGQRQGLLPFKP